MIPEKPQQKSKTTVPVSPKKIFKSLHPKGNNIFKFIYNYIIYIYNNNRATSKLKDFKDMIKVQSFGFRGEALNSISNIADLIIITKTETDEVGTKLQFQKNIGQPPIKS